MKNLIEGFLSMNADLSTKDEKGRTCTHLAIDRGYLHVVKALVDHGAPTDLLDSDQHLPVEYAIRDGNDELAALLLRSMDKAL